MDKSLQELKQEVEQLKQELQSVKDTLTQYMDHQATKGSTIDIRHDSAAV